VVETEKRTDLENGEFLPPFWRSVRFSFATTVLEVSSFLSSYHRFGGQFVSQFLPPFWRSVRFSVPTTVLEVSLFLSSYHRVGGQFVA
jgi:hypothetical protein